MFYRICLCYDLYIIQFYYPVLYKHTTLYYIRILLRVAFIILLCHYITQLNCRYVGFQDEVVFVAPWDIMCGR